MSLLSPGAQRHATSAALFCAALLVSLPFLVPVHTYPITTFYSEWVAAVVLAAAAIATAFARPTRAHLHASLPVVLLALLAACGVHYARGMLHYTYSAALLLIAACALFVAYLLGRWFVAAELRRQALTALAGGLLAAGVLSVLLQFLQMFDGMGAPEWLVFTITEPLAGRRLSANLAQPNHLATLLVWGMLGCLFLARDARRAAALRALLALLALLACGLALTGSRMGALFGAGVVGVVLVKNALTPVPPGRRVATALVAIAGYAAGLTIAAVVLADASGAASNALVRFGEGSFGQRISMWQDAWRIAVAHPWLGVGVGEYGGAQYLYAHPHPSLLATNNPHNFMLHIAAEFGLPVAVLVGAIAVTWCLRRLPALLDDPDVAFASLLVFVLLAHALLEYPLWSLFFSIPLALLVALAEPARLPGPSALRAQRVMAPIALAVLATAVVMRMDYVSVESLYRSYLGDIERGRGHEPETVAGVMGALGATFFAPQVERLFVELVPPEAQRDEQNLALVERVTTRLADLRVVVRYIELLMLAGRIDAATAHVARLRVFAGVHYPVLRDELLAFARQGGADWEPARRAIQQAGEP